MLTLLWELIRKDLKVFAADRRAMIISFAVPVAIASFMGMLTQNMNSGSGDSKDAGPKVASKIKIAVVDEDKSAVTKKILEKLHASGTLEVQELDRASAQNQVQSGALPEMLVLTKDFGKLALDGGDKKAQLIIQTDPSKGTEVGVIKGSTMGPIVSGIMASKYGDVAATSEDTMPFEEVDQTPKPVDPGANWSGVGHSFAGMAVQGLLFWAIESAMGILRERKQGIWRRLRSSPVSPGILMLGKILSGAIRAFAILAVVFGAGAILFHMRVEGTWLGFILVCAAASLMAATFGMFVAALGKTEQQSRGLSILAVLGMVMLGGAWFPSFLMPEWIQTLSKAMPVKWAVDGLDSTTWRAQNLSQAMPSILALTWFAIFFGIFALKRIKWDYEA